MIDLAAYGVTTPLMSHQPSVLKSANPATLPFLYDRAAYGVAKVGRELARVVPVGRLRAMDVGRIEVSAFGPTEGSPAPGVGASPVSRARDCRQCTTLIRCVSTRSGVRRRA